MTMPERREQDVFRIRFSAAERALLKKRAAKEKMTEADHLRACMVMDAVTAADVDALKIAGTYLAELLSERIKKLTRQGVLTL